MEAAQCYLLEEENGCACLEIAREVEREQRGGALAIDAENSEIEIEIPEEPPAENTRRRPQMEQLGHPRLRVSE